MELEVTWGRTFRVWWAYAWRIIGISLVAFYPCGQAAILFLDVLPTVGVPVWLLKPLVCLVGILIVCLISLIPMKMILGRKHGDFRVVLLPVHAQ